MASRGESRDKVLERAQALAQRGAFGRAIAALEEWLGGQPDDDRVLMRIADLRRRVNDDAGAVAALSRAAELQAARGFASRVAAILQQAIALAPDDLSLVERLAAAKAELSLHRDAAQLLERIAQAAAKAGDLPRVIALRRRVLGLLPADAGAAVRLADALVEAGQKEEAIALLEKAAEPLRLPANEEVWLLVQDRLADLLPPDPVRAREIASVLIGRGSPKRALARLKPCVTANPEDVEALTLFAQAYAALGQGDKVVAAWRELAKAHQRAGRLPEAQAAWARVRELAPGDAEAAAALPPPPLPPRAPGATLAEELAEADFFEAEGLVDEARAILRRLHEAYPDDPAIPQRLEALDVERIPLADLMPHDGEEADLAEPSEESTTDILDRVQQTVTPPVSEAATHRDLANAFLEIERYDEALAELDQALAADPSSAGLSHAIAGRCHLARGAPRDAIDAYRRALDSQTLAVEDRAEILCELGDCHQLVGQRDEAAHCFTDAKRLSPELDGEVPLLAPEPAAG